MTKLSERERAELERFYDFCRRVGREKEAGVSHREAMQAVYPDVYEKR